MRERKKKASRDRDALKVLAIPRAVLEPERGDSKGLPDGAVPALEATGALLPGPYSMLGEAPTVARYSHDSLPFEIRFHFLRLS
jgi:hypothetical protein